MILYNNLNAKLSNSQLNKLKSVTKNETKVTSIKFSANMIGDSNDETNFPHKLLLKIDKFEILVELSQIIHHLI